MRCGCDLVHVSRVSGLLERQPGGMVRMFTEREVADACRGGVQPTSIVAHRRLAARWAAKEATVKALDRPDLGPRDIEVRTRASGAPELWVEGTPADLAVSMTHDGDLAMAFVVATSDASLTQGRPEQSDRRNEDVHAAR